MLHTLNSLFNVSPTPRYKRNGRFYIINLVKKSSTNDPSDPLSYRGITITSSVYKLYCNALNSRLSKWESEHSIIYDSQNGILKERSTKDQILSLKSIIDTGKLKRQSTFEAFIDVSYSYMYD